MGVNVEATVPGRKTARAEHPVSGRRGRCASAKARIRALGGGGGFVLGSDRVSESISRHRRFRSRPQSNAVLDRPALLQRVPDGSFVLRVGPEQH